jgi:predicted negative regulator of RcsB-dependent stress response
MKSKRRHELKEDQFTLAVYKGLDWARDHLPVIVGAAIGVILLISIIVWTGMARDTAEEGAATLLADVQTSVRKLGQAVDDKAKAEALSEIVNLCDRIATVYGSTNAAALAQLEAGRILSKNEKATEAIPHFQKAMSLAAGRPNLVSVVRQDLAGALAATGKFDEAIKEFESLPESSIKAQWDIGRCYEAQGKEDDALKHYRKVVEGGDTTIWSGLAASRIRILTEGEALPEPEKPAKEKPESSEAPVAEKPEQPTKATDKPGESKAETKTPPQPETAPATKAD